MTLILCNKDFIVDEDDAPGWGLVRESHKKLLLAFSHRQVLALALVLFSGLWSLVSGLGSSPHSDWSKWNQRS